MPIAEISGARRKRAAQRPVGDALDRPAVERGQRHGDQQHQEQRQRDRGDADRQQRQEGDQRDEGADHEHVAMGEIDHADDAVDHRVADGDQAVDRAERDAVDELLEKYSMRPTGLPPRFAARPLRGAREGPPNPPPRLRFAVLSRGAPSGQRAVRGFCPACVNASAWRWRRWSAARQTKGRSWWRPEPAPSAASSGRCRHSRCLFCSCSSRSYFSASGSFCRVSPLSSANRQVPSASPSSSLLQECISWLPPDRSKSPNAVPTMRQSITAAVRTEDTASTRQS